MLFRAFFVPGTGLEQCSLLSSIGTTINDQLIIIHCLCFSTFELPILRGKRLYPMTAKGHNSGLYSNSFEALTDVSTV